MSLTSVEASANGHLYAKRERDPVLEAVLEVSSTLAEIRGACALVTKRTAAVMATAETKRGQWTAVGTCAACDRVVTGTSQNRLKTGYCNACYVAWCRWKEKVGGDNADHRVFEDERRAQLDLPSRRRGRHDQAVRDTDSPYVR